MQFEVSRVEENRLKRQLWLLEIETGRNSSTAPIIKLTRYSVEQRQSLRHKWRRDDGDPYYASSPMDDWRYGTFLPRGQVPMPDDVRNEALQYVVNRLTLVIPKGHHERQEEERGKYTHR